jgi:hypothetical protein
MLPEQYQSAAYWDDEAAMRAFLDDVEALAAQGLKTASWIDRQFPDIHYAAKDTANELHAAASVVCPGIEDRA